MSLYVMYYWKIEIQCYESTSYFKLLNFTKKFPEKQMSFKIKILSLKKLRPLTSNQLMRNRRQDSYILKQFNHHDGKTALMCENMQ